MTRQDAVAAVILTASLATWAAMCSQPARADTEPVVMYVVDLASPALEVPEAWAEHAGTVAMCETGFRWPSPIGAAGERSAWQVHPIHFPAMRRAGLNPDKPYDLTRYAIAMWERSGWGPWSCRPLTPSP